jgi:sterol desaturase/sphingolipid hydroxylase (fatty acid hydroxylase superfamily)
MAQKTLHFLAEPNNTLQPSHWSLNFLYAVFIFIFNDFFHYVVHYLKHSNTFLWEFHKVHHSAEVMTPFAYYRSHPVEDFVTVFFPAVFTGITAGLLLYITKIDLHILKFNNLSVVYLPFMTVNHLNHSHVPLSFGRTLNKIFSSPIVHQVHHSNDPMGLTGRPYPNLSRFMSFWDWLFNNLYLPTDEEIEKMKFGLADDSRHSYRSLRSLYLQPFKNCFFKLKTWL